MIRVQGLCEDHKYNIEVNVRKLTSPELLVDAAQRTSWYKIKQLHLAGWYRSEHSPIRTQEFWVDIVGMPHFVHTHYVRHHVGIQPFVRTGREDRGMKGEQTRWTPGEMSLLINAQALINISRLRLCSKAHQVTREVQQAIKQGVQEVDPDLARFMVRECVYRCGYCKEPVPCGFLKTPEAVQEVKAWLGDEIGKRTLFVI